MQLEIGMGSTEGGLRTFQLLGEVKSHLSSNQPIWLRLAGVYSSTMADGKADEAGKFVLSGLPQGMYILMTTQNGRILDVRPIDIPTTRQVLVTVQVKPVGDPSAER
jgi:hypothetical protein